MTFELRREHDESKQMDTWEQNIQAESSVDGKDPETTVYCVGNFMEIVSSKDRTLGTSGPKDRQRSTTMNRESKEAEIGND